VADKEKSRKLLAFDLKQDDLKKHYPKPKSKLKTIINPQYYKKAYRDIKQFLEKENWEHTQGSGYISKHDMSNADVYDLINKMVYSMPWVGYCINKGNIGNIADLEDIVLPVRNATERFEKESHNKDITTPSVAQNQTDKERTKNIQNAKSSNDVKKVISAAKRKAAHQNNDRNIPSKSKNKSTPEH